MPKAPGLAPPKVTSLPAPFTVMSVSPVFVTVTVTVPVCPAWTFPKSTGLGENTAGPLPAEDTATLLISSTTSRERIRGRRRRMRLADQDVAAADLPIGSAAGYEHRDAERDGGQQHERRRGDGREDGDAGNRRGGRRRSPGSAGVRGG